MLTNKEQARAQLLKKRAFLFRQVREFFHERGVIEVDCPILSEKASCDAYIDLIEGTATGKRVFLHSSPEYGMKRLLAAGSGDIYQLSHVFRDEEVGKKHNPEFMLCEWYRLNFTFEQMIDETAKFIHLFLEKHLESGEYDIIPYRDAFIHFCQVDPDSVSLEKLQQRLGEFKVSFPQNASIEELLHLCYSVVIEPNLGLKRLAVITDFPPKEAALAKLRCAGDKCVALRFEFYYQGLELANGYHELSDFEEQADRFNEENQRRLSMRKNPLPIDTKLLDALKSGFPDCCGVAVGVDRLMMLHCNAETIADVIPFPWEES